MAHQIFVNLPVKDLNRSIDFFTKLGFTFDQRFTDERATCMVISNDIYVMLLVEEFFKTFTKKQICDSSKSVESLIALSADSREKVDELVDKAISLGSQKPLEAQDHVFMYERSFEDPDGHYWSVFYMDMEAVNKMN